MTDTATINRTLGSIHTDLGYLLDLNVITQQAYDEVTAKIPRRYKPDQPQPQTQPQPQPTQPQQVADARPVPSPPAPPAYGLGSAEALYDYTGTDAHDLSFKQGDHITILEYVNSDWWRGSTLLSAGIFPSNYVKVLEKPPQQQLQQQLQQQQQAMAYPPVQYDPSQHVPVQTSGSEVIVKDKRSGKLHSVANKFGNAAIFGAG